MLSHRTTLAVFVLPDSFPKRDLILLTALTVVLGTLVIQGITLEPLIRLLRFPPDSSRRDELEWARQELAKVADATIDGRDDKAARALRSELEADRIPDGDARDESIGPVDALRLETILAQREALQRMRSEGTIEEDTFHALEQELDLSEVAAARRGQFELVDS